MKSNFVSTALSFGIALLAVQSVSGQTVPTSLTLKAKVRDFREIPDQAQTNPPPNTHPDFNNNKFEGCNDTGYVAHDIQTDGAIGDTAVFPMDNRTPKLVRLNTTDGRPCFNSFALFNDWYNDVSPDTNRPFLTGLTFNRNAAGMYVYDNNQFFPLDAGFTPAATPLLAAPNNTSFGVINNAPNNNHIFGFTLEFHANFTYQAQTATRAAQVFNFRGDDDVWVFINGKLAIDLGGVHVAESQNITLDAATAAKLGGLVDGRSYILDFFFAERHTTQSNLQITTSLVLTSQKVSTPFATPPGQNFVSEVDVTLQTSTPDATIYYTLNGATPDSNSLVYTGPIAITKNTTVKAIAYKQGWSKSDVMTETYTKTFTASTLDILDQNGNPLTGGYLTEQNTAYTVKLTTTQAGLASVTPNASTLTDGDHETITIPTHQNQGDFLIYSGTSPLKFGAATANNGTTDAASWDSLVVKWVNPVDPTDVAEKHVLVRPKPTQSIAYFSTKPDGSDTATSLSGNETTIYLVVLDEILPPGAKPTVTVTTSPTVGNHTKDSEVFNLAASATPGKYIATIPVDRLPTTFTPNDGKLQLAASDDIKGVYKDPVDGDSAIANSNYGSTPEIDPNLQFTDKSGNVLPAGVYYSPDEGTLYLDYHDDWFIGISDTIPLTLTIVNQRNAGSDTETVKLVLASHSGSTGDWKGTLALNDSVLVTPRNTIAETYILGTVTAKVTSHSRTGAASAPATATLLVANKNEDAVVTVQGPGGPGVQINRGDSTITISVKDQSLTSGKDTIYAQVTCTGSHDGMTVMLVETSASSGQYVSGNITKAEGGKVDDAILQCLSTDQIKVTYTDPVYNNVTETHADISNPVTSRVYFTPTATSTVEIGSVNESDAANFYVQISAHNQNVAVVDTLLVTLTTANGDVETFVATETGPNTDKFNVAVPFDFVTGNSVSGNHELEGKISPTVVNNHVTATATVTVDGAPVTSTIDLVAAFDPVVKAYITDSNGDGAADKVYVVFKKPLSRLPATLDAQWNDGGVTSTKTVAGAKLSFLGTDSTIVVADFGVSPFKQGVTSADATNPPHATLPANDALFAGQKPVIDDSIGPVLKSVIKKPANVNALVPNDPNFNMDTLIVTVSEPLKASGSFKDILKFATSCDDYAHAITIVAAKDPTTTNDTVYTVIVDNSTGKSPQTGNCVFLNADPGKFTDLPGNNPPQFGVVLDGTDRTHVIQLFRGYPPVAGLDPNNSNFQVAVEDSRDPSKSGYATPAGSDQWEVLWIPPAGYVDGQPYTPYTIASINDLPSGSRETSTPVKLPTNISTIQVVSTTAYIAHITIFDIYGNFVKASTQVFGGAGELQNLARVVPKGLVSYLYWDMKDRHGQLAGQGVYVWKVQFEFKGGKQEIQYTRTGLLRQK